MTRTEQSERRKRIVAAVRRGECLHRIAVENGVSVDTVRKARRAAATMRCLNARKEKS